MRSDKDSETPSGRTRSEGVSLSAREANALFAGLEQSKAMILAVSGGPDSTALLWLAARWRRARKSGPKLVAITVDHGLRRESAAEARMVGRLAKNLGVAHRTLRWNGRKPKTGVQEAARAARYRLLADAAKSLRADCIVTAHTLDDQAETVLFRLARGSGLAGLGAMAHAAAVPGAGERTVALLRPLLDVPKARLIATLHAAKIGFADDPSNRDPRFTRPRLRSLMPQIAAEGLDAHRLGVLARRLRRADAAIEVAVDAALAAVSLAPWPARGPVAFDAARFRGLPAEIALRLLGRAVAVVGDEGPVELAKLEVLAALAPRPAAKPLRRTLAGALVSFSAQRIVVERAPPRRGKP
jgi:tRNA(Ile)-lysidine synthase